MVADVAWVVAGAALTGLITAAVIYWFVNEGRAEAACPRDGSGPPQ